MIRRHVRRLLLVAGPVLQSPPLQAAQALARSPAMTLPPEERFVFDEYEGQEEQHEFEREPRQYSHHELVKNMCSSIWTTRNGLKIPVTEITDDHLRNIIALLMRVEMPMGHDFPSDGMAAYYADQQMDHERDKYTTAQVWLRVLRKEQHRRRDPSARCSHGVCFHDCSAQAETHRMHCAEDFQS